MSCSIVANTARLAVFLFGWLAPIYADALAADMPGRNTAVGIEGEKFAINGQPTYAGRTWRGKKIEGLLLNIRMVQARPTVASPFTKYNRAGFAAECSDSPGLGRSRRRPPIKSRAALSRDHSPKCLGRNRPGRYNDGMASWTNHLLRREPMQSVQLYPPLETRVENGVYQVKDQAGKWMDCESEEDALALSQIPPLTGEASCESNFGKGFVPQFEAAAVLLREYRMDDMARFFERRAQYFREHETQPY